MNESNKSAGLSASQAKQLLAKFGPNEISRKKTRPVWHIVWEQISSPLTLILIATAAVSLLLNFVPGQEGGIVDGVLILSIVALSGIAGFVQDFRAEKTIEALRQMAVPKAAVRREGQEQIISSREVVPGDVILLQAGDIVPADAALIDSRHLSLDESILTGESQHVEKASQDTVFKGTTIQAGQGEARVTATGMGSKLGHIASTLENIDEENTPFQLEIKKLSRTILWFIGAVIAVIFVFALTKFGLFESFLFSISLAVAAIPEGLPAIMAIVLALGAQAMVRESALVRKLNAVESMGDVEVICTDKTGTITQNEMSVVNVYQVGRELNMSQKSKKNIEKQLLLCAALCNDARLLSDESKDIYEGSQTGIAILKFASQYLTDAEINTYQRLDEIPFTHERKFMSVLCSSRRSKDNFVYSLGAPEKILAQCDQIVNEKGQIVKLSEKDRQGIMTKYADYGQQALRVVAGAYKNSPAVSLREGNLIWLGLLAMKDPPRAGVKQAIAEVYQAGIRVIMLTGDYPMTAQAVAKEVGLISSGSIIGDELEQMDDHTLKKKLDAGCNIFARISPFHKLRILRLLKESYTSVAMTGDGVNDALALKQADVGIAMGMRGTEVAKEASDMILLDDHFSTIRDAIREGRRSLDNIKKFINYLAVSNFAEIGVLFIATVFMSLKEPILAPAQILWINLITDGLPAIALGLDPARPGLMKRKPRGARPLIDVKLRWQIGAIGIKKTIILFATFLILLPLGLPVANTALFTGFILYEFVRIATIRQQEKMSLLVNKWLLAALGISLLLQLIIVYSPLNKFFNISPLPATAWLVLLVGITIGYFSAIVITKLIDAKFKD